jgi:hypothetical protein
LKTNNYLNINQFIDLFKHFIFLIVCPLKNNDYLNNQIITISTPISLCNQPQRTSMAKENIGLFNLTEWTNRDLD